MNSRIKVAVVGLAAVLACTFAASMALADDKPGSPFKDAVLSMFGYTKKTVEKEVNAVGTGVKKGADVVVEEVKDVGKLATGDKSKAKDVLVKPVTGATKAAGETAYGVINAPIEAGKETYGKDVK